MSIFSHDTMTNHHEGPLGRIAETLHVWRERHHARHELTNLSERDLHDVGLSWSDAAFEAEKPFWRA
jgi:uncharacterized protein YjiS (DUF1127 family)